MNSWTQTRKGKRLARFTFLSSAFASLVWLVLAAIEQNLYYATFGFSSLTFAILYFPKSTKTVPEESGGKPELTNHSDP